ncbi:putative tetratricopeptide-like helical domain superfamily [Dioscorea sansibarensis]
MAALRIALSCSSFFRSLKPSVCHHVRPFPQALSSFSFYCPLIPAPPPFRLCILGAARSLASGSNTNTSTNSPASFDWSDDDEHEEKVSEKSKRPPPYDPFSKKASVVEEAGDPSDLQAVFHKMRTEGLTNSAIKMFDALSKDGLTHEALELFSVIKDKGSMPDVVAHTAVIEAYASAGGHSKDAIRTFDRMLASGVSPNAYTYTVLIKGLARDGKLPEAHKYLLEMMGKGMCPNAGTYVAVFEAYSREQRIEDARSLLEEMRGKGFNPDEKAVRDQLGKRGQVFRSIMDLLFHK